MSIPAKIILHVGAAKTGSTAIQNALDAQYDSLLSQGILFPRSILRRSNAADPLRTPGHLDLLDQLASDQPTPLLAELDKHAGQVDTLLLSIENVFHYGNISKLKALADFLRPGDIHMVTVLRDQISWLESFYYETVVGGISREQKKPDELVKSMQEKGILAYRDRVDFLTRIFEPKKQSVLAYRDRRSDLPLLERFLAATDILLPGSTGSGAEPVNVSYRFPECIEGHRRLNGLVSHLPRQSSQDFSEDMKRFYRKLDAAECLTPGVQCLPSTLREQLVDEVSAQNASLSRVFLDDEPIVLNGPDGSEPPVAMNEGVITKVVDHGIELLAAHAGQAPELYGSHYINTLMAGSRVVLLADWETALHLAAAKSGRMVFTLCNSLESRIKLQSAYDRIATPGAVIALNPPKGETGLASVWDKPWFRDPDIIFLKESAVALLDGLPGLLRKTVTVVVDCEDPAWAPAPNAFNLVRIGRFVQFDLGG